MNYRLLQNNNNNSLPWIKQLCENFQTSEQQQEKQQEQEEQIQLMRRKQIQMEIRVALLTHQMGKLFNAALDYGGQTLLDYMQNSIGLIQNKFGWHKYSLKTTQRQAFLEIFNLHAKDGKISKQNLADIFYRIGYTISSSNFQEICLKAFNNEETITFERFMQTYKISQSPYDICDIHNAFKLIAGENDTYIPIKTIYNAFVRQSMPKKKIDDLMTVLNAYIDQDKKMFNYQLFLSHLS